MAARLRDRPDGRWASVLAAHPVRAADPAAGQQPARALVRAAPGRARLRGHVIVVGLGSIGVRVVEELRARPARRVVVVERDEANRHLGPGPRARRARCSHGDATDTDRAGHASTSAGRRRGRRADQRRPGQHRDRPGRARPARPSAGTGVPVVLPGVRPRSSAYTLQETLGFAPRPLDRRAGRALVRGRRAGPGRARPRSTLDHAAVPRWAGSCASPRAAGLDGLARHGRARPRAPG